MKQIICLSTGLAIAGGAALPQAFAQSTLHWYYCDQAQAYYPYVTTCPTPWRQVDQSSNTFGQPELVPSQAPQEAISRKGQIGERSWAQGFEAYWEATGVGGIFMALGGLLFASGAGNLSTTPTRIETRSGGPGVILRTKHPGHVPTKAEIMRGCKLVFLGMIVGLFGASITYGPAAVYHAVSAIYLKTIS